MIDETGSTAGDVMREARVSHDEIVGWLHRNRSQWLDTATLGARGDKLVALLVQERTQHADDGLEPDGNDERPEVGVVETIDRGREAH